MNCFARRRFFSDRPRRWRSRFDGFLQWRTRHRIILTIELKCDIIRAAMTKIHFLPLVLGLLFVQTGWADEAPEPFDHVLDYGSRLEFYRLSGFGPPGSDCHVCRTPQHVNCDQTCYEEMPSLTLICSRDTKAVSIGPFDRAERIKLLDELFKTDAIEISTPLGYEPLEARRVVSVLGDNSPDSSIDIEDLDGLKNALTRASGANENFFVKIGTEAYKIPLTVKIQESLYRFLKQCPD